MALEFQWDPIKAASNVSKHGVGFADTATAFADPMSITIPDPLHSQDETRLVLIGRAHSGRLLVVVHVDRGQAIRLISARTATRKERKTHEEDR